MEKSSKIFAWLGYIYIALPILIFFIGWCNPVTAVIGTLVIITSLYFAFKNAPSLWLPANKKQIWFLISIFTISLIWVYLSGIGALVFQNSDHDCRNPIFELLVTQPWPVFHEEQPAMLTYYIAFWLPSAVIGKIFNSIQIGYYCQILWATLGVFLFFYYVLANLRKKNYVPIILFIFFSGLDIIGSIFTLPAYYVTNITSHLEWWLPPFQFSSMTTQLFWVFNQAIAAWVIIPLLNLEKNNKSIGFLYSCLFLHSTLPAIGMFPFILYWCLKNGKNKLQMSFSAIKASFLSLFTFQNIIGSFFVFIVCYFYLSSNIAGGVCSVKNYNTNWFAHITVLLIFFFLEAGIFVSAINKIYRKKLIYYITILCLLIYPAINVGYGPDFCMRATIPALVILYLMICKALEHRYFREKCSGAFVILIFALLLGSVTPVHEFARTFYNTLNGVTKVESNLGFHNFYGWSQGNRFLKYFGKKINFD